jgi:hypothetical protein
MNTVPIPRRSFFARSGEILAALSAAALGTTPRRDMGSIEGRTVIAPAGPAHSPPPEVSAPPSFYVEQFVSHDGRRSFSKFSLCSAAHPVPPEGGISIGLRPDADADADAWVWAFSPVHRSEVINEENGYGPQPVPTETTSAYYPPLPTDRSPLACTMIRRYWAAGDIRRCRLCQCCQATELPDGRGYCLKSVEGPQFPASELPLLSTWGTDRWPLGREGGPDR